MNSANLSPDDLKILKRLEKLREDDNKGSGITDENIRQRLAALRGESSYSEQKQVLKLDKRSDQQKCDDLLAQFTEECAIDKINDNQDVQIKERLDKLKEKKQTDATLSKEDEIQRVIRQAMLAPSDDEDSVSENENSDDESIDEETSDDDT